MSQALGTSATAWAKLNLSLHVVGRGLDGYHQLDSLVVFADVGDRLTFQSAREFSLTLDGPMAEGLIANGENLVTRAAHDLAVALNRPCDVAVHLHKVLPLASGIGGGSADAAASLLALNQVWGGQLSSSSLADLGLKIGADVPVCLYGKPCHMTGIGEKLHPLPKLPPVWLVLVNPNVAVSTRAVFAARSESFTVPKPIGIQAIPDALSFVQILRNYGNDLMGAALGLAPAIGAVLQALEQQKGCLLARMSGSGATCFGLFSNRIAAIAAAAHLLRHQRDWWVVATNIKD